MKVFKFGGASVKSANAIINLAKIIDKQTDRLVIVISAMDKTTNALEKIAMNYFWKSPDILTQIQPLRDFHFGILDDLFTYKEHKVYKEVEAWFAEMEHKIAKQPSLDFDYEYDQIVSYGELISTTIVSNYFNEIELKNNWVDIRDCLKTGSEFRDAVIDWELSKDLTNKTLTELTERILITQGFIGSTINNITTTLGREGSDFTAAALTYILDADQIIIWKDVEGIYNADPEHFNHFEKLSTISYQEAIELAYFGAKVIHPKTIKPLQNKGIPLFVKSFLAPEAEGTIIQTIEGNLSLPPVYIIKQNQILISISPKDFSFIAEDNLSKIFALFAKYRIKINISENSAISFSVCVDWDESRTPGILKNLQQEYKIKYNTDLTLITIRHYTEDALEKMTEGRKVLLEQRSRTTVRLVVI
jgi:aspartate kinase